MDKGRETVSIRHTEPYKGRNIGHRGVVYNDIVFDKSIFLNVFYKDIRRVYIYKKAERLANALCLITPAFTGSVSLKGRAEAVAVGLTDAASLPAARFSDALVRELLALSGVLSMARAGGLLSVMNIELIASEIQSLLTDIAAYEEPRLALPELPHSSSLARQAPGAPPSRAEAPRLAPAKDNTPVSKGHESSRQTSILSLIKEKGKVSIKDIALVVRDVSEKTLQRDLQGLIDAGRVTKQGERRWSTYSLG